MKNQLNCDHGYSLLSVLLLFTLISIVGITLVGITMNSSKFVSHDKQTIEDKTIAQNNIEEAMVRLDKEIEKLNSKSISSSNVLSEMKTALNNVVVQGGNKYKITSENLKDGVDGVYMLKATIKSPLGNSGKEISKEVILSTIAKVFQYSLVSPGTVTFNGAAYIEGDVLTNVIQNRNEAKFISGSTYMKKTSYPAIKGSLSVTDRNGYKYYNNKYSSFDPNSNNLNKYFSIVPKIKNSEQNINDLELSYTNSLNKVNLNLSTTKVEQDCYRNWLGQLICTMKDFSYNEKTQITSTKLGALTIRNKGDITVNGNLIVTKNLTIESGGKLTVNGSIKVEEGATLKGEIVLKSAEDFIYIDSYTNIDNFKMTGKMFINHNADIKNDFNTNGTVFVRGTVDIENLSNNAGTLLVIADNKVKISNNSLYTDEPKVIDAFIYSNNELEIYGVGSHLKIQGGIYGKSIILNATKGKTKKATSSWWTYTCPSGYDNLSDLCFQKNQNSLDPTTSRLSVIYKKEFILNPPTGIPTIEKIQIKELNTIYD